SRGPTAPSTSSSATRSSGRRIPPPSASAWSPSTGRPSPTRTRPPSSATSTRSSSPPTRARASSGRSRCCRTSATGTRPRSMATSRSERASGPLFKRILVANRGEIAVRVMRACRELGIESVAVYSEPDRGALHVRQADHAYPIGPARAAESYLRIDKLIAAAKESGAEAVHPGYGFLSERAAFAQACADARLVFIGPSARAITAMGDKVEARRLMRKAGVPVVPGSDDALGSDAEVEKVASEMGFPLMLKAAGGGGGKGMRLVESADKLKSALRAARSEARSAFGDDRVYVEKAIVRPRHIEVQVLGDTHGHVVHLYERECSIQRRHQKVIEESPSTAIDQKTREEMGRVAVAAARAVDYVGAGTIEFLVDQERRFYFLEMNTRIQVEHPITEAVTGVDLVKAQIEIAAGRALGHPAFRAGDIDTGFIARHFKPGALAEGTEADLPLIGAALAAMARAATVASANGARPPVPPRSRWRELARREALRE